jgi:hypothetical protein
MNRGDIIRHEGTVDAAYNDMTIDVLVPGINDSVPLTGIEKEWIDPMRWKPRAGDLVVLWQRMAPLHPDRAVTWIGWASDDDDTRLVPPWLDGGKLPLISEDSSVAIVLEDENDDGLNSDGPIVRLGGPAANEPVVIGTVYKAWMEGVLDEVISHVDTAWAALQGLQAFALTSSTATTATQIAAAALTLTNAIAGLSMSSAALTTKKGEIEDHLSDFIFAEKAPDMTPEPSDAEE